MLSVAPLLTVRLAMAAVLVSRVVVPVQIVTSTAATGGSAHGAPPQPTVLQVAGLFQPPVATAKRPAGSEYRMITTPEPPAPPVCGAPPNAFEPEAPAPP